MADVICYGSPGKRKSRKMVELMGRAMGWPVSIGNPHDPSKAACFYGVTGDTLSIFNAAMRARMPYFYIDHAYFGRGQYFRVTMNALQCDGIGETTGERWRAHDIELQPWRRNGRHILVCPQSESWHAWLMGNSTPHGWSDQVTRELRRYTDRPIIVRHKPQIAKFGNIDAVAEAARLLADALRDAWAVVVYQSGVGVQSILQGVPVFALGPGAVSPMALDDLSQIESPYLPDDGARLKWAGVLADNQWSREEMENGTMRADLWAKYGR